MPKILFSLALLFFLSFSFFLLPFSLAQASTCPGYDTAIVQCGQGPDCRCEITDLFNLITRVFNFIVWKISLPLAGLIVVIGGVLYVISGVDPGMKDRGKKMIIGAGWAIGLLLGAWLIVDIVLKTIGYTGVWSRF